jgi:enamine deaminase RidA (YjgF/YER057c/UK114 family)
MQVVNPSGLAPPKGYSHGIVAEGRLLFVAGQIGWTPEGEIVGDDFVEQFDQALANVLTVVSAAGGAPQSVVRMTIYVLDKEEYLRLQRDIGARYRARMGRHFPAMTLIEVCSLLEAGARVEIEATAVL